MSKNTIGRIGVPMPGFRPFIAGTANLGGLVATTVVRTLEGEIPVEFLSPGDRVITRRAGAAALCAIEIDEVQEPAVEFTSGALDQSVPEAPVILPASQLVLLRNWRAQVMFGQPQAVTPAGMLVDHGIILDRGMRTLTLFRLIFDRDHVIYAGGLELTSAPIRDRLRRVA